MELRMYQPDDLQPISRIFYETVQQINSNDYDQEQINAWAGCWKDFPHKNNAFLSLHTIVAIEKSSIIGYGNISDTGYLDHLFIHKDFQRQGVATAICVRLEQYAHKKGNTEITVHASITAKPFFQQRGYQIIYAQQVEVHGVILTNYVMKKNI